MNKLELQLKACNIKRYHNCEIIGEQNVAEHSYGVAQLVRHFTGDNCSPQLLMAALDHDIPEYITGDMPHPAKIIYPELKAALDDIEHALQIEYDLFQMLTEEERVILKCADLLESALFGLKQWRLGNQETGLEIIHKIETAFLKLDNGKVPQQARNLMVEINNEC